MNERMELIAQVCRRFGVRRSDAIHYTVASMKDALSSGDAMRMTKAQRVARGCPNGMHCTNKQCMLPHYW